MGGFVEVKHSGKNDSRILYKIMVTIHGLDLMSSAY